MPRVKLTISSQKKTFKKLRELLKYRLKTKGPMSLCSTHEAYGIIKEEENELLDEVQANNRKNFKKEVLDIAVACIIAYMSEEDGGLDW